MNIESLTVAGAFLVRPDAQVDERGAFARTFCHATFAKEGLETGYRQCSTSFNTHKHTLRGMHYQVSPHEEVKLVRCTRGAACHVIVDLRPESDTFCKWARVELNSDNRNLLYVPAGVAHGFITLSDATEIFYQITTDYEPDSARGVRWDDPKFGIEWPATPTVVSERDAAWPDYEAQD